MNFSCDLFCQLFGELLLVDDAACVEMYGVHSKVSGSFVAKKKPCV